ncbi:MAG: N-acetylmuramoyl-L-alanine amidase [Sedimentisphaerales bacterium]|nr:N-acetylmuramoyl-L-alanine amidase [Sedimentisphaerales bacterium]
MMTTNVSSRNRSRAHRRSAGLLLVFLGCLWGCNPSSSSLPRPTVQSVRNGYRPLPSRSDPLYRSSPARPAVPAPAEWVPPASLEDRSRWRGIIVHHSATDSGNAAQFDQMHKNRRDNNGEPWLGLGYHFVVNNGHGAADGKVEVGFRWRRQMQGAHCRPRSCTDNYWNEHTIGICLVGNFEHHAPSAAQYESLVRLIRFLQQRYNIPADKILGHGDVPGAQTACPGRLFSWAQLRRQLDESRLASY